MKIDQIHPTSEQMAALLSWPRDQAIVMVNIIRFRELTKEGNETGQQAYQRYMKNVTALLQQAGGRVLWKGQTIGTVIGDSQSQPDMIFTVEYPSAKNFLGMVSSEQYRAIAKDRTIALEYGGLIACKSLKSF